MGKFSVRIGAQHGKPAHWAKIAVNEDGPGPEGTIKLQDYDGTWWRHSTKDAPNARPLLLRTKTGWTRLLWMSDAPAVPAVRWGPDIAEYPWIAYGDPGRHVVTSNGVGTYTPIVWNDKGGTQPNRYDIAHHGTFTAPGSTSLDCAISAAGAIDYFSWPDDPGGWFWHEVYPMSQGVAVIDIAAALDYLSNRDTWTFEADTNTLPYQSDQLSVADLANWSAVSVYFSIDHRLSYSDRTAAQFVGSLADTATRLYRVPFGLLPGTWNVMTPPDPSSPGARNYEVPFLGTELDFYGGHTTFAGPNGPVTGERIAEITINNMPLGDDAADMVPGQSTYWHQSTHTPAGEFGNGSYAEVRALSFNGILETHPLQRTYTRADITADDGKLAFALASELQADGTRVSPDVVSIPVPGGYNDNNAGYTLATNIGIYVYVHFPAS